jgi:hypothetical protein
VAHALHLGSRRKGRIHFRELSGASDSKPRTPGAPARATRSVPHRQVRACLGGTLFLDAVHELSIEHQRELQGILERHSGDVRVVASTRVDVRSVAWSGAALYGRANRGARRSGPSRGHSGARRSLRAEYGRQLGKQVEGVSPASMQRLESLCVARQHPRAGTGPRARDPRGEGAGHRDRRGVARTTTCQSAAIG